MSIVALISTGLQTHQRFSVGLMLQDSNCYSIAPKQRKLQAKLEIFLQHLCVLSLYADFCKTLNGNRNNAHEAVSKVHKEGFPLPARGQINAAIRHYYNGVNGASNKAVLFPRSVVHCQWPFFHCLTLEPSYSQPPGFGYKRGGSPGSANQSGGKKQRSGQQNNSGNNGNGDKGNGQGPSKKKQGFGPQQPSGKKLACLFYKLDSGKYDCCVGYNFTKWDHVFQHLKRKHLIKGEHCPICREQFEGEFAEIDKNAHGSEDTCQEITAMESGKLLDEEYHDLSGQHGSHEEKWYKAWRKLFGERPAPYSPFIESPESLLEMRCDALERELPYLLVRFLHEASTGRGNESIPVTTEAILSVVRGPTSAPNTLGQVGNSTEQLSTPGPLLESPAPESSTRIGVAVGIDTDTATQNANLSPATNWHEFHWASPDNSFLQDLLPGGMATFGGNEDPDQWINFPDDLGRFE
ncbi:hypothetical protein FGADI_12511 [Fusarium gaditjirri]|uniref:C2H2-type domain-containing protein n=1 Tax=Fusarium gaditjirri TaxID=282569 RepID=A0A8H4WP39_9HYPO|nr:hypothetical protein FGADI_12511 [Fusarium gaditjirri]